MLWTLCGCNGLNKAVGASGVANSVDMQQGWWVVGRAFAFEVRGAKGGVKGHGGCGWKRKV